MAEEKTDSPKAAIAWMLLASAALIVWSGVLLVISISDEKPTKIADHLP